MTLELKSNLSQIFRQQEARFNLAQSNQMESVPLLKPFPLRASVSPFVVDNQFALQLDEIV